MGAMTVSPSTRRKDQLLKRSKYEEAGVAHYWIVDPLEPSFLALSLTDSGYVTTAQASGHTAVRLTLPFGLEVVPADLLRRG